MVAFKRVTAPFPGVITARNTNVGDLITANNTNMEMFHIQQTNPLRIYFRVPQANAPDIRVGQSMDVVFSDLGGKRLPAKVATTSESITPNSRTLLVELHMDNPNNEIQPGSYAQVRLTSGSLGQVVTLPNNTLLFRAQGLQVGVVKPDNSVELHDIKVGRDFGTTIEIVQGVTPSDKVIVNPSDSLTTGTMVRVAAAPAASPSPKVAKK
jgi:RND family efflux transporter MFP subunit